MQGTLLEAMHKCMALTGRCAHRACCCVHPALGISLRADFDSGNATACATHEDGALHVQIRPDPFTEKDGRSHFQWFCFHVKATRGRKLSVRIDNAGEASYPKGYAGYKACASYDNKIWFRIPETRYEDGVLHVDIIPEEDSLYLAYFPPYTYEQHMQLIDRCKESSLVTYENLGETLDGRSMDLLHVGTGASHAWLLARQHPGETMAEWWMEGMLKRLIDPADQVATKLRSLFTFHVVPNMNVDGSVRGHLRTNAAGANLNREWMEPSLEYSPEVFYVRNKMDKCGVDFCLDVHGDEECPYNFLSGAEGIPSWNSTLESLFNKFGFAYHKANPDFGGFPITPNGYPLDPPGSANLRYCTNQVGERYKCLSATLEMPFKDTIETPNETEGWSPGRSMRLGASVLDALLEISSGIIEGNSM